VAGEGELVVGVVVVVNVCNRQTGLENGGFDGHN
jgi:hypothetical protein